MKRILAVVAAVTALGVQPSVFAGMAEAEKWINDEFQPSTLSKADQLNEMEWFVSAAEPLAVQRARCE